MADRCYLLLLSGLAVVLALSFLPSLQTTKHIAQLRRQAHELNALADALELELRADVPPPPLVGSARRAAEFIKAKPGSKNEAVAIAARVTPEAFRSHVFPKLRPHGFYSVRGAVGGYFPPNYAPNCSAT